MNLDLFYCSIADANISILEYTHVMQAKRDAYITYINQQYRKIPSQACRYTSILIQYSIYTMTTYTVANPFQINITVGSGTQVN